MILRKAYKVRLKTKADTQQILAAYSGANRFVWNKALALNKNRLDREKKQRSLVWYNEIAFLLKLWKASDAYGRMAFCGTHPLKNLTANP